MRQNSPTKMRVSLKNAELFAKAGVLFVAVPVETFAEYSKLIAEATIRLEQIMAKEGDSDD